MTPSASEIRLLHDWANRHDRGVISGPYGLPGLIKRLLAERARLRRAALAVLPNLPEQYPDERAAADELREALGAVNVDGLDEFLGLKSDEHVIGWLAQERAITLEVKADGE